MDTVIALDVGHSAVKAVCDSAAGGRQSLLFRSVATPAFAISEDSARNEAARETVMVDGRPYFFGETAVLQGRADVESGLSQSWVTTPQYLALCLGAFKKLAALPHPVTTDGALVVVGLPAKYFSAQRSVLQTLLQQHAPKAEICVLPQPIGPFCCIQFNPDGTESRGHRIDAESWGVIEIGHYTTDVAVLRGGTWVEHASGSCRGGYMVAEAISRLFHERTGHVISQLEATGAIELGYVKAFGDRIDLAPYLREAALPLTVEILDHTTRLMEKEARTLDGIVVAGGAAPLVLDTLRAKWPHTVMAENSRMTVAEGFCRFGCASRIDRRVAAGRQAANTTSPQEA